MNHDNSKTYNVLPGPKMGIVTIEYLEKLLDVLKKHDIPFMKFTSAQRFAIAGHSPEIVKEIWQDFGQSEGPQKPKGIHYVQACPGKQWCKYGRQDSLALGKSIEEMFMDISLPARTKVGISGCAMNCCAGYFRDIGVFGMKKGWTLIFGGNGGGCPRIGDVLGEGLDEEQLFELIRKCLNFYRDNARKLERTGRLMRRLSLEELKNTLNVA